MGRAPEDFFNATSVGGDQTWQESERGVPLCVGRLQFTESPCSFTISPVIKENQPRNYQSVNYWDSAKQIQLVIESHCLHLQDASIIQMNIFHLTNRKQCLCIFSRPGCPFLAFKLFLEWGEILVSFYCAHVWEKHGWEWRSKYSPHVTSCNQWAANKEVI